MRWRIIWCVLVHWRWRLWEFNRRSAKCQHRRCGLYYREDI